MANINTESCEFKWLANELNAKGLSIAMAAAKVDRTYDTVYNWLMGSYLKAAVIKPGRRGDVATLIAKMLGYNVDEVRKQIYSYLVSSGQITVNVASGTWRSELSLFSDKVKNISYYDNYKQLSTEQKEMIKAVIDVLEKI